MLPSINLKNKIKIFKILLIFFAIVCFSFCSFCIYADSESTPSSATSGSDSPLAPDLDEQFLYSTASDIAQLAVDKGLINAAAATDYTQSIYLYLQQFLPSINTNIADIESILRIFLRQLNNGVESLTTPSMYDMLEGIYEQITDRTTNLSLSNMLFGIFYALIGPDSIGLPSHPIWMDLQSIISQNGLIASSLSSISTNTKDYTSYFQNMTDFGWRDLSQYYTFSGFSDTLDGTFSVPSSNITLTGEVFLKVTNISGAISSANCWNVILPLNSSLAKQGKVDLYYFASDENKFYKLDSEIYYSSYNLYILGYPLEQIKTFYIHIYDFNSFNSNLSRGLTVRQSSSAYALEYYSRLALSQINHKLSALEAIKEEFASDDLIAAKEASKEVIDQTLDDFTGSGSAAAKKSDVSGAKEVSSALRSGLDSGGSSSDALSVFNNASSFWGWFSYDNANYFTVLTPSRNSRDMLRSSSRSEGLIIDFEYQQDINDQAYFDTIGGYND